MEISNLERREWLVVNGTGSYASGTLSGILTRRYHGLLVAALEPPLGRTLLAVKLDEIVAYKGKEYSLSANRWQDQSISPSGYEWIQEFKLEGAIPVWTFVLGDAVFEKRIWMEPKKNTTYVQFYLRKSTSAVKLSFKSIVNYRGYHNTTHAGNWHIDINSVLSGIRINAYSGATPFYILSDKAAHQIKNEWYKNYFLSIESERGLDCIEDHLHAATFESLINQGEFLTVVFTTDPNASLDGSAAIYRRKQYEDKLLTTTQKPLWIQQLLLAADQFIVDRPPDGKTIIAGYHWFGDWGRDTMISLPGLTLTTGRVSIAKSILETFAKYVDQGMLPNRFPDNNQKPEYNTADATLWYFEAIRAYYAATQDRSFIEKLFPVLSDIIDWHQKGTRYQIHVDPNDGLLHAGEPGVQLTWMDAKIGNWVVIPRTGKAVEINALWYNALKIMGDFARLLSLSSNRFDLAANLAKKGFQRFWNQEKSYCYDVIDEFDPTLRPNQIFAVSLPHSPLSSEQRKCVVDICTRKLLTPRGLRSLDPSDSRYRGRYIGSPSERDSVYHQGTVWGWLLGPYSLAHLKVYQNPTAALAILEPFSIHMTEACVGTCCEIFDGDSPFTPRGCIAQAWTVAETLRAWHIIKETHS